MLKALLFIASVAFTDVALAQYKWVDKEGKVQYGDTPPPGVQASSVRPPSGASQPPSGATLAEKEADFRKRREEAEKERDKQALSRRDADSKRENCARAKENVRILEGGRVARIDPNGERYFLDDAQLSQETARARQAVQEWCS
jgi:Domain of unknown function (DUF4124)